MLRFRIGRIPVEIQPGHLLMAAALGLFSFGGGMTAGALLLLLLWVAIVVFSVLVHELGHAWVSVLLGYRPAIQLVWTGGTTRSNAGAPIPLIRNVLLTLAGPLLGLLVAAASVVVRRFLGPLGDANEFARFGLDWLFYVNWNWSLFNLAPVPPMDGGQVATALLIRAFGRRGFLFANLLALVICVAGVAWVLTFSPDSFLTVILAIFGLRAFGAVTAYFRGDIPDPNSAAQIPFDNAQNLYRQGQLEPAKQLGEQALEAATSDPKLRSRIHHLLGWIAIKQGDGDAALSHFSQVDGEAIEPQALAAAFSLVGDEARAIPLWERAYGQTHDATVLHEWAGALIRDNRMDDARRLPGVDMSLAYTCAERVLFIRGNFAEAARVGLLALEENPKAETAYDTACALARAGDVEGALRLLDRAAELGFRRKAVAAADPDLAPLHADPRFQSWLTRLGNSNTR